MGRTLRQKGSAFLGGHFVEPLTPGGIDSVEAAQVKNQLSVPKCVSGGTPAAGQFLDIAFGELASQFKTQNANTVVNVVLQTGLIAGSRRRRARYRLRSRGNG